MPTFMMPAAPGNCQVCATKHTPDMPHNAQSLMYGTIFLSKHGRDVTWADAVAHCKKDVSDQWEKILKEKGVWSEPKDGKAIAMVDENKGEAKPIPMPGMEPINVPIGKKAKER